MRCPGQAGEHGGWHLCPGPPPSFMADHHGIEPRVPFWLRCSYHVAGSLYWRLNGRGVPDEDPFRTHVPTGTAEGIGVLSDPRPTAPSSVWRKPSARHGEPRSQTASRTRPQRAITASPRSMSRMPWA